MNCRMISLCTIVSVLLALPGFAQGKGGGRGGAGGDRPSMGPPAHSRGPSTFDAPDSTPRRRSDAANGATTSKGRSQRSASPAAHGLSGSMHEINQTAFAQRRELHETLDLRLKSSRDALKQIQSQAKNLRAGARAEFKTALDAVKARERDLTESLKASRTATEANWTSSRERLARASQAHAEAMAQVETLARSAAK